MKKNRRLPSSLLLLAEIAMGAAATQFIASAAVNVESSPWVWQNPLPQGNNLNAISCPSSSTCYAVGELGTILVTTNGGVNWNGQFSTTSKNLHGISCPSTSTCLAVGDGGLILATNTSGSTWKAQNSGSSANLTGISCPSTSVCYAVGGSAFILYTNLGISTSPWQQLPGGGAAISCPTTTACYTVSAASVSRGLFLGGLWEVVGTNPVPPLDGGFLTPINCVSESACAATAFGGGPSGASVIGTTDFGNSWSSAFLGNHIFLNSISCFNDLSSPLCYAIGRAATATNEVFHGGLNSSSWTAFSAGDTTSNGFVRSFRGISCQPIFIPTPPLGLTAGMCFAVGDNGAMVTNAPSGSIWHAQETSIAPLPFELTGVSCPATGTCIAVAAGAGVYSSVNSGAWTQKTGQVGGSGISCPSSTNCFVVGSAEILASSDGGSTWHAQSVSPGFTPGGSAVSCPSTQVCVAAGQNIYYTNNAGATPWIFQKTFGGALGVSCANTSSCMAVGLFGTIVYTNNLSAPGGQWIQQLPAVTSNNLDAVSCPTPTSCFAVGDSNTFLAGTFRNNSWSWAILTPPLSPSDSITSISCLPPTSSSPIVCYAGSFQGEIVTYTTTTNGLPIFNLEAAVDPGFHLFGMSCTGSTAFPVADFECAAVGQNETILTKTVVPHILGTGELTPNGGSSDVGEPVTFTLTWTVPGGQPWRSLKYLDLRLSDDDGVGLWARFLPGNPSAFALLDGHGNIVADGVPGSTSLLDSPTATLDLAKSNIQAAGPASPIVTVNFALSFKPAAAGDASPSAARVYQSEISASNLAGTVQGPEKAGSWAVRPDHR
jgi:photosystem II stability/assembly factor-like uncharacterized protein